MSLGRARIIKAKPNESVRGRSTEARHETLARRVPASVVDARAEADRILREASAAADGIVKGAQKNAVEIATAAAYEARESELARLAAELLFTRAFEEQRAARTIDRTIEIATLLAERLVGEAIVHEPTRVAALAERALLETRGARLMRIEACADDVQALETVLASLGSGGSQSVATIETSAELGRGSLLVHTELGRIDARLAPQLQRLAEAVREVLRASPQSERSARP